MQQKLRDEVKSIQTVVELVKYRAEYQKYMEAQKAKEEEILERERSKLEWLIQLFFNMLRTNSNRY